MQLDARAMRAIDHFRQCDERGFSESAERELMLFVQAPVHQTRQQPFDKKAVLTRAVRLPIKLPAESETSENWSENTKG
jgi:hypothetical protein